MKIIVAPDSFKGSLSSPMVADAMAKGILSTFPLAEVLKMPVADGGEGTADTIASVIGGTAISIKSVDPLLRDITATYYIADTAGHPTAIIDIASASGITHVKPAERDIMKATSYGTGILLKDAYRRGCRHFLIGLGGSATCDCGQGITDALGSDLKTISTNCHVKLLCDVDSPLCGPDGAAFMFAPQKGASPEQVVMLDKILHDKAKELEAHTGRNVADQPGAGAAGGIGAMFMALFNCSVTRGIDTVLDLYGFSSRLAGCDLVITGEGKMDDQTLHGKAPLGVLDRSKKAGVPVVAVAGQITDSRSLLGAGFRDVECSMKPGQSIEEAMNPGTAFDNVSDATRALISRVL